MTITPETVLFVKLLLEMGVGALQISRMVQELNALSEEELNKKIAEIDAERKAEQAKRAEHVGMVDWEGQR